jgi:hypothetical protein
VEISKLVYILPRFRAKLPIGLRLTLKMTNDEGRTTDIDRSSLVAIFIRDAMRYGASPMNENGTNTDFYPVHPEYPCSIHIGDGRETV